MLGRRSSRVPADLPRCADSDDVVPEKGELPDLMLCTLAPNQIRVPVDPEGPRDLAAQDCELQRCQVRAGKESRQV